ncbi:MAG: polymerase epsilon subunit [Gammaproteobacteria bacterium]|nr:polymerase epsilon subunit [Gammaproteobacteria bacterium]
MKNDFPDYIVIEGPIGVGKTALAKRLADTFNTELMLESPTDNPFLPGFYEDPQAAALQTQLFFLFQRAKQIAMLRQTDMFKPVQIADFFIEKDRLFAGVTLNNAEFELYQQVYDRITLEAPIPDLVIYLQAPTDVLLKRILGRGIDYEKYIDEKYLQRIANAYIDFFYHYNSAPLLIVNTADFDLVNGSRNYNLLLEYIKKLPPGRNYFNPKEL